MDVFTTDALRLSCMIPFPRSLPLVEAFTTEALRFSCMIPFNEQREAVRDTSVAGYFVPKVGLVQGNKFCVFFMKKVVKCEHSSPIIFLFPETQGTHLIVANFFINKDERIWDKPDTFSPDRFITSEGKFQAPKEGFFAFGSGKKNDWFWYMINS